jgi:hypothetical protein
MLKNKLNFIVAGTEIGYIREIKFMKKFSVETNYLGWDEKYFYLEQRFVSDGKLHAYGLIKAVFLQKGKVADPEYIAGLLGVPSKSSALPEHMNLWKQMAIAKREYTA